MFPHSPWIHIGGDEAETGEWEKCPITQAYMKKKGIETVGELYAEYVRTAAEIVFELGCTPVVWEGFAKEFQRPDSERNHRHRLGISVSGSW